MAEITGKRIQEFQSKLLGWYSSNGRKFPWRNSSQTNYKIIISEILLQRSRAETISEFFPKFIKDFPSWAVLANARIKKIENKLKPVGLQKQRSKRLKQLASEMVKRGGRLPKDRFELEKMPFIGQYIANSIELLIFKRPMPLLDVNMARVLERYFGGRKLADIRYDPYLRGLAKKVVSHSKTKELNWAIIDYAAIICKVKNPDCKNCSLHGKCNYYRIMKNQPEQVFNEV